jgi:hypothetical protein
MACRIERLVLSEDLVVFLVSGSIECDGVNILQDLIARASGRVSLDLREVTHVERNAVTILALCERNGVELRNLPAYLREWVAHETSQITGMSTPGRRSPGEGI